MTYSFNNGAAQVNFGGKRSGSTMVAGGELLYISPDGNFIFGGSYTGWDMFVGVRAATSAPSNYAGLYYQAGLDLDASATNSGYSPFNSYYGSFQAFSGKIIGHQRLSSVSPTKFQSVSSLLIYGGSSDFTYYDSYALNSDGSSDDIDFGQHYVSSSDGTIRVGYGIGPFLSLNVAFQAPAFSGPGVYLSPVGVVNAANSAPFTAQVSPGEFLTLYGSGLANTTASASVPFPNHLSGVQVLINQVAAPVYYVSPTQISVVVPYLTAANSVAQIQVINNGANSNIVTEFTGSSSVGVFTNNPEGGLGYAAALHPDYSVISKSSPAQIGETVAVFLAGMGVVRPAVKDGTAAPNPPSTTTATPLVFLLDGSGHYLQCTVAFSGLAPGFAGLYQLNFTVPAGLVAGNAYLEIIGQDSDTFQALLPVSTTTAAAVHADAAKSGPALMLRRVAWLTSVGTGAGHSPLWSVGDLWVFRQANQTQPVPGPQSLIPNPELARALLPFLRNPEQPTVSEQEEGRCRSEPPGLAVTGVAGGDPVIAGRRAWAQEAYLAHWRRCMGDSASGELPDLRGKDPVLFGRADPAAALIHFHAGQKLSGGHAVAGSCRSDEWR